MSLRHQKSQATCKWQVIIGDGIATPLPDQHFDFIWQDAFSPKKNPDLWSEEWFRKLMKASTENAVLMTYSVARVVKDGLEGAGWHYAKIKAPGKKKHWLKATNTI